MDEERIQWLGATECDICGRKISKTLYDGMTKDNGAMWSTMCEHCFRQHGVEIAWGYGQKYKQDKDGNFYLTDGGPPEE